MIFLLRDRFEHSFIIYSLKITFRSYKFSPLFELDTYYSVYSFKSHLANWKLHVMIKQLWLRPLQHVFKKALFTREPSIHTWITNTGYTSMHLFAEITVEHYWVYIFLRKIFAAFHWNFCLFVSLFVCFSFS